MVYPFHFSFFFFFNDTATTEIYTLSLHDALPICMNRQQVLFFIDHDPVEINQAAGGGNGKVARDFGGYLLRSEEHTSELQSRLHLVCRLLLEKKKIKQKSINLLL